ncbi:MAG TPA: ATP synthase subunit I [Bryobacteraceae bacterium]|nr:ATP synthase subunit I [Bryobacteraceae bacterium]
MAIDELSYDRAARRIGRSMWAIALAGTVATFLIGGWKWGGGFLLGAGFSWLNYRFLCRLVESLGGTTPPHGGAFLTFRYLLLGGGGYVILRYSPINMKAVLTGLFVLIAAVFVEVIFEIAYARK